MRPVLDVAASAAAAATAKGAGAAQVGDEAFGGRLGDLETASGWCFSSSEAAGGRSSAATRQVDDRKGKEECKDKEKGSVSYEKGPRAR